MAKRINKQRFDVFAIGTRLSFASLLCLELSWWADLDEDFIGAVFYEQEDGEFGWTLLARDERGRFRAVNIGHSLTSEKRAEAELRIKISEMAMGCDTNKLVYQGDGNSSSLNLLMPISDNLDKLHPGFKHLISAESAFPARQIIKEIGPCLHIYDNHFLNEFQLFQFDQRVWEIYLWCSLREQGFDVYLREAPDFECYSAVADLRFTVEATTVTPSQAGVLKEHPNPKGIKELEEFLYSYMPMKFGSALTSKLKKVNKAGKHYWEHEFSKDKPFVIAIADFHKPSDHKTGDVTSLVYSGSALYVYLYGKRVDWFVDKDGKLIITNSKIGGHKYKDKEIPSGFFDLPDSENISAVMFSNAGTLPKFDRMGVCAGFEPESIRYFRQGFRFNPDPNASHGIPFVEEVGSEGYEESWSDELQLYHNPNAKYPIDPDDFPKITHHNFIDGKFVSIGADNRVLSSLTHMLKFKDRKTEGEDSE